MLTGLLHGGRKRSQTLFSFLTLGYIAKSPYAAHAFSMNTLRFGVPVEDAAVRKLEHAVGFDLGIPTESSDFLQECVGVL